MLRQITGMHDKCRHHGCTRRSVASSTYCWDHYQMLLGRAGLL